MSPDEAGSSSAVACAHAESYTSSGKLKTLMKLSFCNSIDGLDVGDTCLSSAVDLLLDHFACAGKMFSSNPAGQVEFDVLCKGQVHILVLGFFLIFFLLVGTFGVFIPILLTIVIILTLVIIVTSIVIVASFVVGVVVSSTRHLVDF